jgi:hypothetical protein
MEIESSPGQGFSLRIGIPLDTTVAPGVKT